MVKIHTKNAASMMMTSVLSTVNLYYVLKGLSAEKEDASMRPGHALMSAGSLAKRHAMEPMNTKNAESMILIPAWN